MLALTGGAGCGDGASTDAPRAGTLAFTATVTPINSGPTIAQIKVTISQSNGVTLATDQLADVNGTWQGIIGDIPVAATHVHGDAYDTTGTIVYSGDQDFTVTVNGTIPITLDLQSVTEPPAFTDGAPKIDTLLVSAQTVTFGGSVHFDVTAQDPDNDDTLTYAWSAGDGSFSAPSAPSTDWTAPASAGPQTIEIAVTDSKGVTTTASATINVTK